MKSRRHHWLGMSMGLLVGMLVALGVPSVVGAGRAPLARPLVRVAGASWVPPAQLWRKERPSARRRARLRLRPSHGRSGRGQPMRVPDGLAGPVSGPAGAFWLVLFALQTGQGRGA